MSSFSTVETVSFLRSGSEVGLLIAISEISLSAPPEFPFSSTSAPIPSSMLRVVGGFRMGIG